MLALFADEPPSYGGIAALLDIPIGSIGPTRSRTLAKLRVNLRLRQVAGELD